MVFGFHHLPWHELQYLLDWRHPRPDRIPAEERLRRASARRRRR
jgi:hypothetical protein